MKIGVPLVILVSISLILPSVFAAVDVTNGPTFQYTNKWTNLLFDSSLQSSFNTLAYTSTGLKLTPVSGPILTLEMGVNAGTKPTTTLRTYSTTTVKYDVSADADRFSRFNASDTFNRPDRVRITQSDATQEILPTQYQSSWATAYGLDASSVMWDSANTKVGVQVKHLVASATVEMVWDGGIQQSPVIENPGGTTSSGTVPSSRAFSLILARNTYEVAKGSFRDVEFPVSWKDETSITITDVTFSGSYATWLSVLTTLPLDVTGTINSLTTKLSLKISVPDKGVDGSYTIPVTVTAKSPVGAVVTAQDSIVVVVNPSLAEIVKNPDLSIYAVFGVIVAAAIFYPLAKKRRV